MSTGSGTGASDDPEARGYSGKLVRWTSVVALFFLVLAGCGDDDVPTRPPPGEADILVSPDGTGDYPTIQEAVAGADSLDVIGLTDGVFTGEGNRDIDFGGKSVTVRSVSGNADACILDCQGSQDDAHRGFHFRSGEMPAAVVEGLTIRGGNAMWGGAIFCEESSPTLRGCVILSNTAAFGGGIGCRQASPSIIDCTFNGNLGGFGGGGIASDDGASPSITRCRFLGNSAADYVGGAVACGAGSPSITDCRFQGNSAGFGGAVHGTHSSLTIWGCEFNGNLAAQSGGAISSEHGSFEVRDGTFTGNTAGAAGGGIRSYYDAIQLTANAISGNTAQIGGGISVEDPETCDIVDCIVTGNTAISAGGIHGAGDLSVRGCIVANNVATAGGGMAFDGVIEVSGCTIVGNSGPQGGSGIAVGGGDHLSLANTIIAFGADGRSVMCHATSDLSVTCCDIYGNQGGDWIGCLEPFVDRAGNISVDPLFCDRDGLKFRLRPGSPCGPAGLCERIGAGSTGCR
jgi:predicted outer membrane repeat protein